MILKKQALVALFKKFAQYVQGTRCKRFYVEIKIIGIDEEFAEQADGMQKILNEIKEKEKHAQMSAM